MLCKLFGSQVVHATCQVCRGEVLVSKHNNESPFGNIIFLFYNFYGVNIDVLLRMIYEDNDFVYDLYIFLKITKFTNNEMKKLFFFNLKVMQKDTSTLCL